jgi:glycogen debranching enzyme
MNDQVTPTDVLSGGDGSGTAGPTGPTQPYLNNLVTAVCAPAMSLSRHDGQMRPEGVEGLYVQDLRALSQFVLTVNGAEPVALGYELVGGAANTFESAVAGAGNPGPDPTVFVTRRRELNPTGMLESFTLRSHARATLNCHVEVRLACDLAAISDVRSGLRPAGKTATSTADGLSWADPGRGLVRLVCTPKPADIQEGAGVVGWDFAVEPGRVAEWSVAVQLEDQGAPAVFVAPASNWGGFTVPQVEANDHRLGRLVELSVADLEGLRMAAPADRSDVFLAAGAPWYLTLFGRDSIWAARLLLPMGSELAEGTLRALAQRQGRAFDKLTGEEPGKILHEVRPPDRSTYLKTEDGHNHRALSLPPVYYGTVDATPLWVCLLHDAWKWGMPADEVERLLPPMRRCLTWLTDLGCHSHGFVSYIDESGQGLANQGWKDSWDAVQFRDGRIASAPLALCEVQGYAYEAAMAGAELVEAFDQEGADRWREFAAGLAKRFRARFWVEDSQGAYPAIALEADGTPVDSLSSNIGHLLGTGLLDASESDLIARRLGSSELNSGFGLRTLASSSAGFNPLSYHCGSVWAHDTAIAIAGLARTSGASAREALVSLVDGLLYAAEGFGYRLPELYGGHARGDLSAPLPYPASCHPQAWAAASSIAILAALLGVRPDVPGGTVELSPVVADPFLTSAAGLRVGGSEVAVRLSRDGEIRFIGGPKGLRLVV